MPRIARKYFGHGFFHVMVHSISNEYVFNTSNLKRVYLGYVKDDAEINDIKIIAYCIMGNHAHFLIFTEDDKKLSLMMKHCNETFAMLYNHIYQRRGHVFMDRFKTQKIESQMHLENCVRYIHSNPVEAKICSNEANYEYSSYNKYVNKLISPEIIKLVYGNDENYLEKVQTNYIKKDLSEFIDIDPSSSPAQVYKNNQIIQCRNIVEKFCHENHIDSINSNKYKKRELILLLNKVYEININIISQCLGINRSIIYKILKNNS